MAEIFFFYINLLQNIDLILKNEKRKKERK